jgi:hypothetical protein
MNETTFFGLVPGAGPDPVVTLSDGACKQEVPVAAALQMARRSPDVGLVVPDALDLARLVAERDGEPARRDLCWLAAAGRLVCLATAEGLAQAAGRPLVGVPDRSAPGALGRDGRRLGDHLTVASVGAGVLDTVRATFGPLGLSARVRGAVVCGLTSAHRLGVDRRVCDAAAAVCRRLADERFAAVVSHPDAAGMFKRGAHARPNGRGFRGLRKHQPREWLAGQLDQVLNTLGLPIRPVLSDDLARDLERDLLELRNWPVWALGTRPLVALAGLQAAEHLGWWLKRLPDVDPSVTASYTLRPQLASQGPDLDAYRRFLRAGELPPVFVPPDGRVWLSVQLPDLPLAAAEAMAGPGGGAPTPAGVPYAAPSWVECARQVLNEAGVPALDPDAGAVLVSLIAAGASAEATAAIMVRHGPVATDAALVGRVAAALTAACPGLSRHLEDPTLAQIANALRVRAADLGSWVARPGHGEQVRSFFERYVGSGMSKRVEFYYDTAQAVKEARYGRFQKEWVRPSPTTMAGALRAARDHLRERSTTTPTGRVFAGLSWVEARALGFHHAEDTLLEAGFRLSEAGYSVATITRHEVLVELPHGMDADREVDRVSRVVSETTADVLGGQSLVPQVDEVSRW